MNNTLKTRRLFFALWPSDQVRQSIVETFSGISPQMNGRVIQPHNLHITLHFIGQVTEDIKDCMHDAALSINSKSFELDLDCFGHFRRAKIFWLGCQKPPHGASQLHNKLGLALGNCGYQSEIRAFTPHITLMRKCIKPALTSDDFSILWPVNEFVLVESIPDMHGVKYQVIEKYSLS